MLRRPPYGGVHEMSVIPNRMLIGTPWFATGGGAITNVTMEQGCHVGSTICPAFDLVIGQFALASGRVAVLVVNQDDRHRVQPGFFTAAGSGTSCRNGDCMKVRVSCFPAYPV
jgi:hypothetical protein